MRAGTRRHKVRIEVPTTVKVGGVQTTTWSLYQEVYASFESLKGYEKAAAQATWPGSEYKIGMRYIAGVLTTMRIVYGGLIYSILDVDDVELRHRDLYLICQTGVKSI